MAGDDLRGVLDWVVLLLKYRTKGVFLVRSANQEDRMPRRQKSGWQQRDAPLIELRGKRRGGHAFAVVDQRVAGKQTGDVRVRPHSEMHQIELRWAVEEI